MMLSSSDGGCDLWAEPSAPTGMKDEASKFDRIKNNKIKSHRVHRHIKEFRVKSCFFFLCFLLVVLTTTAEMDRGERESLNIT